MLSLIKLRTEMKQDQMEMEKFCKWLTNGFVCAIMLSASNLVSFPPRRSIHSSESQQEFFRMLDEKIEKVKNDKPLLEIYLCFCVFVRKKKQVK